MTGFVYVLKRDNLYKIGISRNVPQRMQTIGGNNEVVHIIKTDAPKALESDLHNRFAEKRTCLASDESGHTEWFDLCPDDLKTIAHEHATCPLESAKPDGLIKMTTILVTRETRDRLAEIGKKRETFDEIIDRLLKIAEKGNAEALPSAV